MWEFIRPIDLYATILFVMSISLIIASFMILNLCKKRGGKKTSFYKKLKKGFK
jgi:hypothetical protein